MCIDTLFLFSKSKDSNDYALTTDFMERLKYIADKNNVAIIAVHHSKKVGKETGDIIESALGSTGIVSGPDHLLYLQRTPQGQSDAILHFISKDAEPAELALRFDPEIMGWSYQGEAQDLADTEERQDILDLLRQEGPLKSGQIAKQLGKKISVVSYLLKKMLEREQITRLSYGLYSISDPLYPTKTTKSTKTSQTEDEQLLVLPVLTGGSTDDREHKTVDSTKENKEFGSTESTGNGTPERKPWDGPEEKADDWDDLPFDVMEFKKRREESSTSGEVIL